MYDITSPVSGFLDSFSFSLITVAVLPHKGLAGPMPQGKYFYGPNMIRAFTPQEFFSVPVQQELQGLQASKWGVYFTLNEGNGLPDPTKDNLNCGKRMNITTLKSLCIDTDTADSKMLLRKLTEIKLLPHYIIETRPDRYHFYFLIKPVPSEGENVLKWQALQKYLASLVPDLDQSMTDVNQLLRIPGYFNFKDSSKDPHNIKILRSNKYAQIDLDETFDRLSAEQFTPSLYYTNGINGINGINGANGIAISGPVLNGTASHSNGTYNRFTPPEDLLKEGSRRTMITRYMEHLIENVLPLNAPDFDYWVMVDAFIAKYIAPSDQHDFLPGGSRRSNLEQYFTTQRDRRIILRQQEEAQRATLALDHVQAIEEATLPDSFYLEFPGDLGMLVRELNAFAPMLSLELCFAGALMISGALKAETFRFNGAWPMINGIILVSTGAGKSTLIGAVEEVFKVAGLGGNFPQHIGMQTSVQSLHQGMYKAGGVATLIVDEAGDYMKAIASKNAPQYALMIRSYFKKATVANAAGATLEPGESLSLRVPARFRGFISIWLFLQPSMFRQCMGVDDMSDGLLPRFFVFQGKANYDSMFDIDAQYDAFNPSPGLRVWIESLMLLQPHAGEMQAEVAAVDGQVALRAQHPRAGRDDVTRARMDAVYRLRSEARAMSPKIQVKLTDDAKVALMAYLQESKQELLSIVKEDSDDPRIDIIMRIQEMVNRFICSAAPASGLVSLDIVEAAVTYCKFSRARFFARELKEMGDNSEVKLVVEKVAELSRKKKDAVTSREIGQAFNGKRRVKNLASVLKEAVSLGELWEEERPSTSGKKKQKVYGVQVDEIDKIH